MLECNRRVEEACGCVLRTFAYPCGNTFVGRGEGVRKALRAAGGQTLSRGQGVIREWHNAPAFVIWRN